MSSRRFALLRPVGLLLFLASLASIAGCAGHSTVLGSGEDVDGACTPTACAAGSVWDEASCSCAAGLPDAGPVVQPDATVPTCPPLACPPGWGSGVLQGQCACVMLDAGPPDATVPTDGSLTDAPPSDDSSSDANPTDANPTDANPTDAPPDADYDACNIYCPYPQVMGPGCTCQCTPNWCGAGYAATPQCGCTPCTNACPSGSSPAAGCGSCVACSFPCSAGFMFGDGCSCVPCAPDICPSGKTPGSGCNTCVACTNACPAGFTYGEECGCVPDGVDASVPADSGVTCSIGGYNGTCAAGSWCPLGTCGDGKTQYGCYCNPDGTATCNVTCPLCTIPGVGMCSYDAWCTFGTCAGDASEQLECYCYAGGSSCQTLSCPVIVRDSGVD
jgi:hypothetical protein